MPNHIYTPDDNDKWHRSTNGRFVSHAEMGIENPTPDPVDKIHGNSKKSTNEQHVYEIYEKQRMTL